MPSLCAADETWFSALDKWMVSTGRPLEAVRAKVAPETRVPAPVNISVKRLKLRLSGSARNSQKRVSRHAGIEISGRFHSNPAVCNPQHTVEKTGRPIRFKSLGLYTNIHRGRYTITSGPPASSTGARTPLWIILAPTRAVVTVAHGAHGDSRTGAQSIGKKCVELELELERFCAIFLY